MISSRRLNFIFLFFLLFAFLVIGRLFYWQVRAGGKLTILAESQRISQFELPANRGKIFAADGFPLVDNQPGYLLYADLNQINQPAAELASRLAPYLVDQFQIATSSPETKEQALKNKEQVIRERLENPDLAWVALKHKISQGVKEKIEALTTAGLGFERESIRFYPEASLSAHLLGFVGSDPSGRDQGYFGLEGHYELELKGRPGLLYQEKDASGKPILVGNFEKEEASDGRDLVLHLDRAIQFMIEEKLQEGVEKYGAKSGSVVILEPETGAVLGMASWPAYHPAHFQSYPQEAYKNPVVAETFEPGSIFKVVTMAAALNEAVVDPETRCDQCAGPRKIGPHLIHTYNDKYYPETTVREILEHSDNVGMVFVAEKLGLEKFLRSIKDFGFDQPTGIDLEEETASPLRPEKEWREIDLAAASFGQGIAITSIQMVRAVAAIANGGFLLEPHVVAKVRGEEREVEIKPKLVRRVISSEAAQTLTKMMVSAVDNGFPHWKKYGISGFRIAGKCGTAQIPLAGHYDEEKTIASFVGFAPADKPRFVMLVTLKEPTSSPWGANTAAPLWFEIAKKLFLYYGISPRD